jgi:hypothetical protein
MYITHLSLGVVPMMDLPYMFLQLLDYVVILDRRWDVVLLLVEHLPHYVAEVFS